MPTLNALAPSFGISNQFLTTLVTDPGFQSAVKSPGVVQRFGLGPEFLTILQQNPTSLLDADFTNEQLVNFIRDPDILGFLRDPQAQQRLGIQATGVKDFLGRLGIPPGPIAPSQVGSPNTQAPGPIAPIPQTLNQLLSTNGLDLTASLGEALRAFGQDTPGARIFLQSHGLSVDMPIGSVFRGIGLSGTETLEQGIQRLAGSGQINIQPSNQFAQTPPIQLPPGLQPIPFQAPPPPNLPTEISLPPELTTLLGNLQSMLQNNLTSQQAVRDRFLSQLEQGINAQAANAEANQPLLDTALANIQSVLTGQGMSPGVAGLVESAFAPVEAEGQRRLRQAAEEAAASRGLSLTDTPIGQPFLEENRRFLEQTGGQRAQAAIGLREQDAAFSQRVREFQEGLRQQALTNRTDVLRTLGTPEQAASVLANLGLGSRQAAVQEFGIRSNQALSASDQALRAALGQASAGQGNASIGLQAQAQGFQEQLARQQAAIQNQLSLFQTLGDPFQAFQLGAGTGSSLSQNRLSNLLNLNAGLIGQQPNFGPQGFTSTQQNPSTVGSQLLSAGAGIGTAALLFF